MKYAEALEVNAAYRNSQLRPFRVLLACGSTPLHLQTYLAAYLQKRMPDRKVVIESGLYGQLVGTVGRSGKDGFDACAVALEWADLDPRLGFRQLGGWGATKLADIVQQVEKNLELLREQLAAIPPSVRVALSLPTIRLAPAFHTVGWETGIHESRLIHALSAFASDAAGMGGVHILNDRYLEELSPSAARFDLKSELLAGISYSQSHASWMGDLLARLLSPPPPKKGLITDLDGTLWNGIIGEIGVDAISWDLSNKSQLHGLYQQLLRSLAEEGVLIGVASRNSPETVRQAFRRADLLLPENLLFPFEVHWNAKSASVTRILESWNIAADSVVFVDDSPMELAEVKAAHPGIECIQFSGTDYAATQTVLYQLRDLFGRSRLSEEDSIRRESLRNAANIRKVHGGAAATAEDLLKELDATISFDFKSAGGNPRSIELVNKTNQFNLNGRRVTESDWHHALTDPRAFVLSAHYQDKFGPLGTIAVLRGRVRDRAAYVDTWVMSCRAFARRIEHQCLHLLLEHFDVDQVELDFQPTQRNEPFQQFATELLGTMPTGPFSVTTDRFNEIKPPLYHSVKTNS